MLMLMLADADEKEDEKDPETAANTTKVTDADADADADAHDAGGGSDSLLDNKWALVAIIAAFVALLISVVVLAMVCSNRKAIGSTSKVKVHPMSAEQVSRA